MTASVPEAAGEPGEPPGEPARELAHEINNVLAYMISNLKTLKIYAERLAEMAEAGAQSDPALAERLRIRRLLDDLVPVASQALEGGVHIHSLVQTHLGTAPAPGPATCRVEEEIVRATRLVADQLGDGIEIRTSFQETRVVAVDPGELTQVFVNLVRNAAEAMSGEGVLSLSTVSDGGTVVAEVADSGHGIPADLLHQVFDRSFSPRPSGHGLGLYLCARVVKAAGGTIEAQSTEGRGSRFTIRLPAAGQAGHASQD